jgi:hypothetical protein
MTVEVAVIEVAAAKFRLKRTSSLAAAAKLAPLIVTAVPAAPMVGVKLLIDGKPPVDAVKVPTLL